MKICRLEPIVPGQRVPSVPGYSPPPAVTLCVTQAESHPPWMPLCHVMRTRPVDVPGMTTSTTIRGTDPDSAERIMTTRTSSDQPATLLSHARAPLKPQTHLFLLHERQPSAYKPSPSPEPWDPARQPNEKMLRGPIGSTSLLNARQSRAKPGQCVRATPAPRSPLGAHSFSSTLRGKGVSSVMTPVATEKESITIDVTHMTMEESDSGENEQWLETETGRKSWVGGFSWG
eukprot:gene23265-30494_t